MWKNFPENHRDHLGGDRLRHRPKRKQGVPATRTKKPLSDEREPVADLEKVLRKREEEVIFGFKGITCSCRRSLRLGMVEGTRRNNQAQMIGTIRQGLLVIG